MLLYIWMCVMLQAFAPGGERIADRYINAVQDHVRAQVEALAPDIPSRPSPTERVRMPRPAATLAR